MATKKPTKTVKKTTVKKPVVAKSKKPTVNIVVATAKKLLLCNGKPIQSVPFVSTLVAEFIGTFLFVALFFAITVSGYPLFVAFALIGIVLFTGAQVNPAITIASWITRKMCSAYAIGHLFAQAMGATAAWLVLTTYLDTTKSAVDDLLADSGTSILAAAGFVGEKAVGKEWYVFFAEAIGAMILAFGFAAAVRAGKKALNSAVAYGFATLIALTVAGSLTAIFLSASGTSLTFLNPVLAIVANGVSWSMWPIAIYIVAPIIGAIIGFVIYDAIAKQSCECDDCDCDCNCCK